MTIHEADRDAVQAFNAASASHHAIVDTIECKPQTLEGVDWLAKELGPSFDVYVEVTAGDDAPRWLERVGRARVERQGADRWPHARRIPQPGGTADLHRGCPAVEGPFKATAGLHHAVRGSYGSPTTTSAAQAPMYGYLNVILATAAIRAGATRDVAEQVLCQTDTSSLVFGDEVIRWGAAEWSAGIVRGTRAEQLVSFGSCSFREPVEELRFA